MKHYDMALREVAGNDGLTVSDVVDLYDILSDTKAYPVEIQAKEHECAAMGFITSSGAEKIDYDYEASGLCDFITNILDNMELEKDDCTYEFKGIRIWLSR